MADDPTRKDRGKPVAAPGIPVAGTVVSGEGPHEGEPMTEAQAAELRELCDARGATFDGNLTQAQAADRIAALKDAN